MKKSILILLALTGFYLAAAEAANADVDSQITDSVTSAKAQYLAITYSLGGQPFTFMAAKDALLGTDKALVRADQLKVGDILVSMADGSHAVVLSIEYR